MDDAIELNQQTYDWCVRAFDRVKSLLGVRIKLHHEHGQIEQGDIFLFNHFARMETFIPQYLIYKETGAFCRSIAASEFFKGDDRFAKVLYDLGAVPSDHPDLMPMLARDILKGRKIVVFPEGGMVKDRQVLDDRGEYSVYSRSARSRRKHHTGAARLAIGLQIVKLRVLEEHRRGNHELVRSWAELLDLPSRDALIENARRPVTIVPANITFYPLRITDNILRRGAEMLHGNLSQRAVEELIVEGNLFFKTTDMDIRLGDAISPVQSWVWWERLLAAHLSRSISAPSDIFDGDFLRLNLVRKTAAKGLGASIRRLRDRYMRDIYGEVTVNTSHLASRAILKILDDGNKQFNLDEFERVIYLAIKKLQRHRHVHLHRSICNPTVYRELLNAETPEMNQFLQSAVDADLIELYPNKISFKDKLAVEHGFDSVRLENPVEVYANEVEPIKEVDAALTEAINEVGSLSRSAYAKLMFDDELIALEWDRALFDKPRHREINHRETATADPNPYLLIPQAAADLGVLLVHGFLASPAEVRSLGDKFFAAGYTVLAPRLKGHGSSPWDLRERSWHDWFGSVEHGREILNGLCERICVVGFSTGGALALLLAASQAHGIEAVASVCAPIKFRNKNMRFVPLMHGANRIVRWLSKYEGLMPFRPNESEHPHINYRNMPIRSLYELTRLVARLETEIKHVSCPVCLVQATDDRVVDPASATLAYDLVQVKEKEIHWIESTRHGILSEDIGGTHALLLDFVARVAARRSGQPVDEMGHSAPNCT